jgi:membrane protease YdiL (CAAX protease family)
MRLAIAPISSLNHLSLKPGTCNLQLFHVLSRLMKKFRGYLKETRRPVYSATLILPFLCIYHAGTFFFNTTHINGADALILRILSALSVHSMFASALVLIASFIFWQVRTHASWKIKGNMLSLYLLESLCFALILIYGLGWLNTHLLMSTASGKRPLANLVLYCGAGIYEELLFRGFLLGILLLIFRRAFPNSKAVVPIAASLLAALIFSAFHYIGQAGDTFSIGSFLQRTIAGLYFSALFVTRGFGLTAASHAIYDIIVGIFLSH